MPGTEQSQGTEGRNTQEKLESSFSNAADIIQRNFRFKDLPSDFDGFLEKNEIDPGEFETTPLRKILDLKSYNFYTWGMEPYEKTSTFKFDISDDQLAQLDRELGSKIRQSVKKRFEDGYISFPLFTDAVAKTIGVDHMWFNMDFHNSVSNGDIFRMLMTRLANDKDKDEFLNQLEIGVNPFTEGVRGVGFEDYVKQKLGEEGTLILDVGCSEGIITERIARNLPKSSVIGVDINLPEYLKKSNSGRATYIEADARKLENTFQPESIDAILSLFTTVHFTRDGIIKTLRSFYNVLREEGLVVIGPQWQGEKGWNWKPGMEPINMEWTTDKYKDFPPGQRGMGQDQSPEKPNYYGLNVFQKKDGRLIKVDFIHSPARQLYGT